MKRILIIILIVISTMEVNYSQTYVKADFFAILKQTIEQYPGFTPSCELVSNSKDLRYALQKFYVLYYEGFIENKDTIATMCFIKKDYNGFEREPLFQGKGYGDSAKKYVHYLILHDLPRLLNEFDVYVFTVYSDDIEPFEEGTERGDVITVYYPKDPATYYIYKYTPQGWLQIDKSIGSGNTRIVGYYYLKPLALLKIYKYKWNEWLTYKYTQLQIAEAKDVISLIEALSVNIYDSDEEGYQKNYTLLKQKLENNKNLSRDSSLLRLTWSVHGVDLIETPVPMKDKELYSQARAAINTLFALRGYEFSNDKWSKIYRLFQWYNPQTKNPEFDKATDVLVKQLQKFRDMVKL